MTTTEYSLITVSILCVLLAAIGRWMKCPVEAQGDSPGDDLMGHAP
jgi:hypothetical protein